MTVFYLIIVFICTVVLMPLFNAFGNQIGLLAMPGEHRQHRQPTPLVGGLVIMLVFCTTITLLLPTYHFLIVPLGILTLVGILDDRWHLPSPLRLLAQIGVAYLLVSSSDAKLESLGLLFSDEPVLLGDYSLALSLFAAVGVINAVNMSDGMDGLAAFLVIICCLGLLLMQPYHTNLIVLLIVTVLGFLCWNIRYGTLSARTFLGDAGSTTLGLILFFLLVEVTQGGDSGMSPVSALWLLAVPLIDTVAMLLVRPLLGRSPFSADHLHYHHLLRRKGLGVNQTLFIVILIQMLCVSIAMALSTYAIPETIQLCFFLALFSIYFVLVLMVGVRNTKR